MDPRGECLHSSDIQCKKELYEKAQKVTWLLKPPVLGKNALRVTPDVLANWPEKTDICCWWCTYPFDTKPVPMPVKYDPMRDVFYIRGTFCSWSCVKSYALNENRKNPLDIMNVMMLRRRVENSWKSIPCAPHRETLQRFGGKKTIEEFRDTSTYVTQKLPPNMIMSHIRYDKAEESDAPTFRDKKILFGNIDTATETLRLKRPEKGVVRNTLETTMGIVTRQHV